MLCSQRLICLAAVTFLAAAMFVGCSSQKVTQPPGGASSSNWDVGLDKDVVTALSELSVKDRTAALSQKVCPVTDKTLGSMGKPPKVTIEGQELFLCCDGCEAQIRKSPATFLAKLGEKEQ